MKHFLELATAIAIVLAMVVVTRPLSLQSALAEPTKCYVETWMDWEECPENGLAWRCEEEISGEWCEPCPGRGCVFFPPQH